MPKQPEQHCMHLSGADNPDQKRLCCWCGLEQTRVYEGQPQHGPLFPQESRSYHWEPPSLVRCEKRSELAA